MGCKFAIGTPQLKQEKEGRRQRAEGDERILRSVVLVALIASPITNFG